MKPKYLVAGVVTAAVLGLGVYTIFATQTTTNQPQNTTPTTAITTTTTFTPSNNQSQTMTPTTSISATTVGSAYKSGSYESTGQYSTPGGREQVLIKVVLDNNIVKDVTFEGKAVDPTSKQFQRQFGDNFKSKVVGKNIDEVKVDVVAGSSLTSRGFIDALNKIKTQAKA